MSYTFCVAAAKVFQVMSSKVLRNGIDCGGSRYGLRIVHQNLDDDSVHEQPDSDFVL